MPADPHQPRLRAHGFRPRAETVRRPRYADTPYGTMGLCVRVESCPDGTAAQTVATSVGAAGFHAVVEWAGYDAEQLVDAENIHVAIVASRTFSGTVTGIHDGNVRPNPLHSVPALRM
ncbi:hypothetical protein [Streptomyces sp. NPDC088847]|uniref:hypothetical protein n=1 Tax=Streptomyces sp. NPDC088847 TaxID=3365909 RepID=UPI003819F623